MVKRRVEQDESSEDSPNSLDGADYTDRGWTTNGGSDWRSFSWAFGLGPSTSSVGRRRRRGRRGARGGSTPAGSGNGVEEESDIMKELLEIVLWNGEKEIDITEELTDEEDSDDEEMACIKRLTMKREQTIRPRAAAGTSAGKNEGGEAKEKEKGAKVSSGPLSVSNLRFDSLLKIGPKTEQKKQSIARLEQRTTTMERAFKGVLDGNYVSSPSASSTSKGTEGVSTRTTSSSTIVAGGGEEDNFWDDVEF